MASSNGEERITPIEDLKHGMKNVHCIFIVIDKGAQLKTKDGSTVRKCRVADRTGSIVCSLWNNQAEAINSGDIIKLIKGYSSLWKGSLVLYCGKYGMIERLGDFTMIFSETPDMSVVGATAAGMVSNNKESENDSRPLTGGTSTESKSGGVRLSKSNHHMTSHDRNRHHPYSRSNTREQGW